MYLPVNYAPARAGLGYLAPIDAQLEESEFYPPPYSTDAPFDLSGLYDAGPDVRAGLSGLSGGLDWLQADSVISGVPNWIIGAGAAVAAVFFLARSGKGAARRQARQKYESDLSRIDKDFSVTGRARRAARRIPRLKVTRG